MKSRRISIAIALAFVCSMLISMSLTPFSGTGHAMVATRVQIGSDIDGENAGDWSGSAFAMSAAGTRIAIGAPENDGGGSNAGHVRVFDLINGAWTQVGSDIDGVRANDNFGWDVVLSDDGNTLAISAPFNDDSNRGGSGQVRIYAWNEATSSWEQRGQNIQGDAIDDWLGMAIALSADGTRLAASATRNDTNGLDSGHVRVFDWNGNSWDPVGSNINGEAAEDEFGSAVAISDDGNRLAIGAAKNDGTSLNTSDDRGHVRVFDWNGSSWTQIGTDIDGEAAGDQSGASVALSSDGQRLAIGAHINSGDTGSRSGHVRVFDWNGNSWTQIGTDIDGETANDQSGRKIAMSADGNRLAIGAMINGGNGSRSGHVRLFQLINNSWEQVGEDIDGEAAEDRSAAVALSSDGTQLAIGAYLNDSTTANANDNRGHVRVFGFLPTAPVITSVVEGEESLSVLFTPGADNGIGVTNYKYSTDGTTYIALNPASINSPMTISDLTAETAYSITIKAVNPVGDSVASNAVSGTPQQTTTTTIAPTTTAATPATNAVTDSGDTGSSQVKKLDTLPKTGSDTSTVLLISALVLAGGLLLTLRRRIVQ